MVVLLITTTTILMFLAFGSVVLPIKAAVMSALTLGSTMGVLTWMFVDGHGSGLMNYTPQPLMAPMIGLIIAVIWGLSTDYEVFLVSRMVEARERGMSTAEAIRIGTATTGRLITGAALVLAVVAGAFVFSDLVMMKYLAFGLLLALLLDATVVRMFLVPAVMKLLGDDCWWAPKWMKRLQDRLGLGETELPDERKRPAVRDGEEALVGAGAPVPPRPRAAARPDPSRRGGLVPAGRRDDPDPDRTGPRERPVGRRDHADADTAHGAGTASRRPPGCRRPTARSPADRRATHRPAPRNAGEHRRHRYAEDREIESWLGELRGNGPAAPPPAKHDSRDRRRTPSRRPRSRRSVRVPDAHGEDPEATEKLTAQQATERRDRAAAARRRRQRRRICCAAKAAGASPTVFLARFDVVGLGLDDLALFGLLRLQLGLGFVWRAAPAPRC